MESDAASEKIKIGKRSFNKSLVKQKNGYRLVYTPYEKYTGLKCLTHSGSFGFVFSAKMGRRNVLIKQQSLHESAYCEAALRELCALVYLCSPNFNHESIISLIQTWEAEDCLYLVFPRLDCSLCEFADDKPISVDDRNAICTQIISALRHLHHCNIIHRDLRMENVVMMRDCSQVRLIDFGTSRLAISKKQTPGKYVSIFSARAPECENGSFSKASDIWSFGCLLAQMISGKPLFRCEDSVSRDYYRIEQLLQNLPGDPTPHEMILLQRTLLLDPQERIPTDDLYEIHSRYTNGEKSLSIKLPKISSRDIHNSVKYKPTEYKFRDLPAMHENIRKLIDSFSKRQFLRYTTLRGEEC